MREEYLCVYDSVYIFQSHGTSTKLNGPCSVDVILQYPFDIAQLLSTNLPEANHLEQQPCHSDNVS